MAVCCSSVLRCLCLRGEPVPKEGGREGKEREGGREEEVRRESERGREGGVKYMYNSADMKSVNYT